MGSWNEALEMAEASLLLKPDQPAVHGDALRAMLQMGTRKTVHESKSDRWADA